MSEAIAETPQEEDVRAEVRRAMEADGISAAQLARQADVKYGTLTPWLGGTYAGRGERVAEKLHAWLTARAVGTQARATSRRAPEFVMTATAEAIFGVLQHAQHRADLVVISGVPGVGKTSALRAYARTAPRVYVITGAPTMCTPRALLDDIADAVGLHERGLSSHRLSQRIVALLGGTGALIAIDEAQHLTSQTLDQLRTLHDLARIGVALAGNETVYARLEGGTRAAHYAQLYSRVGVQLSRTRVLKRDVEALLDAWEIADAAARELLRGVASRPGGLRNVTKTLADAYVQAAETDGALTADLIRAAWARLSRETVSQPARAAA